MSWIIVTGLIGSIAGATVVAAQDPGAAQNTVCVRLEAQLANVTRGNADPARAEQIKRFEEAANKQQTELDRMVSQSRRLGCEGGGFFSIFGGQNAQCGPLTRQIQQMRGNLDRILDDLEKLQGGSASREGQRQSIIVALAQNNCGPQYRAAATQQSGGFFDSLFRSGPPPGSGFPSGPGEFQSSTFRTVCVRTCDGFFYPISYQTTPARFQEDEQTCQRTCPGAEVALYSHRNPGEDINQAVSINGRPYTELPQAFKYRQEVNAACSCRRPGQSWAEALEGVRETVVPGDIVVTNEKSKALSQPRQTDAQGRPVRATPPTRNAPAPQTPITEKRPQEQPAADGAAAEPPKRAVRNVGPPFIPAR